MWNRKILAVMLLCIMLPVLLKGEDDEIARVGMVLREGRFTNILLSRFSPVGDNIENARIARKTQDVLRHDLLFTRRFDVTETDVPVTGKKKELELLRDGKGVFSSLKKADGSIAVIDVVLVVKVKVTDKYYQAFAKLYDLASCETAMNKSFTSYARDYRELAHMINDEIVLMFRGEPGIAHSKIVFSNDRSGHKEIYIIDYDGYNLKRLTSHKSISIFPRWSPDGKKIIYTSYKRGNPDLYIMNADGSGKKLLSGRQGLNTPAEFSPDGEKIALVMSRGRLPNIFLLDRSGRMLRQLTHGRALDTSPAFSPNGQEIVFISGRMGNPQMYVTDIYGTRPRRLRTVGYSDSPVYSPDAGSIVFSMREKGENGFNIYKYDLDKKYYWKITHSGGSNENPSFSPDGEYIVYTSQRSGRRGLYCTYVGERKDRKLADLKGRCFTPDWGP